MKRSERHAQVVALKEAGLTFKEIASYLRLGKSTVTSAYYDPTGEKDRARKAKSNGTCVDCDGETIGDGSNTPPERCAACSSAHRKVWTKQAVVAAIRRWADEHGGIPPAATDWNATLARTRGRSPRSTDYPSVSTVQDAFGSWSVAISTAGFDAFASGSYGREGEYPEVIAETVALYRSGLSCEAVGERMGVTGSTVRHRLRVADEPRRSTGAWRQQVAA